MLLHIYDIPEHTHTHTHTRSHTPKHTHTHTVTHSLTSNALMSCPLMSTCFDSFWLFDKYVSLGKPLLYQFEKRDPLLSPCERIKYKNSLSFCDIHSALWKCYTRVLMKLAYLEILYSWLRLFSRLS